MEYEICRFQDLPKSSIPVKERKKFYGKENHSRRLFLSTDGKLLYKTWDRDYVRRENLRNALDNDFYDIQLIPAFRALIFDEDEACRGYIMAAMDKKNIRPDKEFLEHIKKKTRISRYFFYDFWKANILLYERKPCLIDLESVYLLSEYEIRKKQNRDVYGQEGHLIKNSDYRNFIEKLYKELCWNETNKVEDTPPDPGDQRGGPESC